MPIFQCTQCETRVEKNVPPIVCRNCQARGKYVEVSGSSKATPPPPQPAAKAPTRPVPLRPTPLQPSPQTVATSSPPTRSERRTSAVSPQSAPVSSPAAVASAEMIREYRLLTKLGEGGMGAVYKAEHTRLRRIVALKVLPAHRMQSSDALARFDREMQAAGSLDHPNIVRALDAGEHEGRQYLVMEYVNGGDVSQLVEFYGPLPIAEACEIVRQAALGLQHAHEAKLVHRDLKPSNLMLAESGVVKILDLGLALLSLPGEAQGLTETGQVVGTFEYMAPEQGGDTHKVDIRADIYALGATLYKLLAGQSPFAGGNYDTPMSKLMALATVDPAPLVQHRPDVPSTLARIVHRMLSKARDARPDSPSEVAELLTPFAQGADLRRLATKSPLPPVAPAAPLPKVAELAPAPVTLREEPQPEPRTVEPPSPKPLVFEPIVLQPVAPESPRPESEATPKSSPVASPLVVEQKPEPRPAAPVPVHQALGEQIAWRYRPAAHAKPTPLRGCAAVDAQGNIFVASGASLVSLSADSSTPRRIYLTGGPIPRSPVIGSDGIVRVHSTDGHLHFVTANGTRSCEPAAVGPPLGWATPLVDAENRTWMALADGGLLSVDANGQAAARPFYRTRRRFDCTGIIVGDVLYVGSEDHFVHAVPLAAPRGDNSWRTTTGAGRTGCAISSPLAMNRKQELLVISQDDQLHAFRRDGSTSWTMPLPGQVLGSAVVDPDDTILLGVSQTPRNQPARGQLLAIDGTTRRARWLFATDAPIESTPVIGDDGVVYFGDNGGSIYAVDRQGQQVWRATIDSPIRSAGTFLGPNLIGFGAEDGSFLALRCSSAALASTGWPKFQATLGQSGQC